MRNRAGSAIYPNRTAGIKVSHLIWAAMLACVLSQITAGQTEKVPNPTSQGDSETILFGSLGSNLWVINSDGSGLRNLTNFSGSNHMTFSTSWSPDGTRVAYVDYRAVEDHTLDGGSARMNTLNVWVMNADGSGVKPLTGEPNRVFYDAVWAPDGRKLASTCQLLAVTKDEQVTYKSNNICVVNADGSGAAPLIRLTSSDIYIDHLAWSPDGRKIAYFSNRPLDGSDKKPENSLDRNIWVMDADGSHSVALTHFAEGFPRIEAMAWSPDSRRIAYLSSRALGDGGLRRGDNIWITNLDGSESFPLTRFHEARCRAFSWSPDGSRMTFSSSASLNGADTANGYYNIWVIKMDGSAAIPLTWATSFESRNDLPAWSPDGGSIAFVSCLDSSNVHPRPGPVCNLWLMKPDGTGARALTEPPQIKSVGGFWWRPTSELH